MASKLFRDLRDTEIYHTGKVAYQGDPIFVVDFVTLTIKNCIVKIAHDYGFSKFMTIYCCEKGKYVNWSPAISKAPSDWICLEVNKNSSTSSFASTTLKGAMAILDLYKSKSSFASLKSGDSIYCVDTRNDKIHQITITDVTKRLNATKKSFVYTLGFGEDYLRLRTAYYESKASTYSDAYCSYHLRDYNIYGIPYFFVKKEDAEAFLDKKRKEKEKKNQLQQIGTDTKLNDAKGNRLHIGDSVAYVNGVGTHISLSTAKIIKATKAYITVLDEGKREEKIRYAKEALDKWVKEGNKPYELDFTYCGVYTVTNNKILLLKKYNQK